jgi:zinc protease
VIRADRSSLPRPVPNPPFRFPPIHRAALSNGLRLWTVPHGVLPLVSLLLLVEAGSAADPDDAHGLASMTGEMLDEGSGARSALDMHDALARIGAQFETEVGSDATVLGLTVLSRHFASGTLLLGDMAVRPRLAADDFARVRELRLHRLAQLRDQPSASADRAFLARIYRTHPYAHLAVGSEDSLQRLVVERVSAFHGRAYDPRRATLIAVGDVTPEALADAAAAAFGEWAGGSDPAPPDGNADVDLDAPGVAIVPRPGAAQSELRIGHVGVSRSTPDFHALLVLNMILGGQFISRLNLNLRERKGYTYGARTAFEFRRHPGPFLLQTAVQTRVTAEAVVESIGEIDGIRGPRPVTREELEVAQAALTRGYARNFETAEQIARAALQLALHRLPDDYFDTFVSRIESVSAEDVTRAASRHLDPARLATVIVGDPDAIAAPLAAAGLPAPDLVVA